NEAFMGCNSLRSIELPAQLNNLAPGAFRSCEKLETFSVAPNHSVYTTIDGILYEKATQTLIAYPEGRGATTLIVPEGIRAIGAEAFADCSSLRSIELPGSLTAIGDMAFSWCDSLSGIELPEGLTTIG